jgi:predicted Zn-dependent protease
MDAINANVVKYNEFVVYVNTLIRKSNSLGAKKFTEGRFNPNTNTIDVYQFSDRLKLKRVITHELGHALGINHNENIRSIMYSVNSGTTTMLSKEDMAALKDVCTNN